MDHLNATLSKYIIIYDNDGDSLDEVMQQMQLDLLLFSIVSLLGLINILLTYKYFYRWETYSKWILFIVKLLILSPFKVHTQA